MADEKTKRRARKRKEAVKRTSAYCEAYGHDWKYAAYGSERLPPGYALQRCSACKRERTVMVRGRPVW